MQIRRIPRKIHKWAGLLLGIQLFLWALSGFYMVVVDIDIIHGDMLVREPADRIDPGRLPAVAMEQLATRYPDARSIVLRSLVDRPVYVIRGEDGARLLDARDGQQISPIDEASAVQVAVHHYQGESPVRRAILIERDPPSEIPASRLPLWRVDFDDGWNSSFYIDPDTGHFVTRRHTLWRVFDFVWMLHIMDYETREDVNNTLLRVVAGLALLAGLSGLWLLFSVFRQPGVPEGDAS